MTRPAKQSTARLRASTMKCSNLGKLTLNATSASTQLFYRSKDVELSNDVKLITADSLHHAIVRISFQVE